MRTELSITQQAQGLALVLAAGQKMDLPDPNRVDLDDYSGVHLHLTLDGLRDWAQWADAPIGIGEPSEYLPGRWAVTHKAYGTIHDLPLTLSGNELGVMTEADSYECKACGAGFGSTAGFVADGTYDDQFEIELTRHMDSACVSESVAP